MRVLVTGGAGYIGSHVVKALGERGFEPVTVDNLSTGHEWAVLAGDLVKADLADKEALADIFARYRPEAVMHFAASISPEESVRLPLKYYRNNVINAVNLLDVMGEYRVTRLVYSSSASVYGQPEAVPVSESAPMRPVSPYGRSKVMVEGMLEDLTKAGNLSYVSLRYFNAAGADDQGKIGQAYGPAIHLIDRALKTARGRFDRLDIYGTDYPTPDGTCVRDYIHVDDLARAHILALNYLMENETSQALNCGYGRGYSVRQVVETVKAVTGIDFPVVESGRRPGDPPELTADNSRIKKVLNWRPEHGDLNYIVKTAWEWEKSRA